jgi:hypothetical protein
VNPMRFTGPPLGEGSLFSHILATLFRRLGRLKDHSTAVLVVQYFSTTTYTRCKMEEKTITIHINDDGMFYDSDLSVEEVIFWLGAVINGAYTRLFEVSDDTEGEAG